MQGWLSVWPPLPPAVHIRPPIPRLPFPLEAPTCRLFGRVPHALHVGVRQLGLGPGDEVLAPAYHHGAEIEALRQAGIVCRWYDAHGNLEPDEDELDALMSERVRSLYLVHYLGFPQDAARWRRWCDDRGLLLIEDATQAWLSVRDGASGRLGRRSWRLLPVQHLRLSGRRRRAGVPPTAARADSGPTLRSRSSGEPSRGLARPAIRRRRAARRGNRGLAMGT